MDAGWQAEGCLIERIDRPMTGLYAVSLVGAQGRWVALLAGPPRARPALGAVRERPRGEAADGAVRGLREKLEGARIVRTFATPSSLGFEARREDVRWWFSVDRAGGRCEPPLEGVLPEGEPWGTRLPGGEALVDEQRRRLAESVKGESATLLRRARERLRRRGAAIAQDLRAIEQASERAAHASLFVVAAAAARPGQERLVATDWSSGEAREVAWPLAPDRPAKSQLEAVFTRAKRMRAGAAAAQQRRDEAELGVMMLDDALTSLAALDDVEAVQALLARVAAELPGDVRLVPASAQRRKGVRAPPARPFRRYEDASGHPILVGRDAASNDELTMHVARPADLWLHARGHSGSHVIVPGGVSGGAELLVDAATLAAHFSGARGEDVIDVQYAERRHVRKRRGSAPGTVEVVGEKVLALRLEPARLARLLATCDRDR